MLGVLAASSTHVSAVPDLSDWLSLWKEALAVLGAALVLVTTIFAFLRSRRQGTNRNESDDFSEAALVRAATEVYKGRADRRREVARLTIDSAFTRLLDGGDGVREAVSEIRSVVLGFPADLSVVSLAEKRVCHAVVELRDNGAVVSVRGLVADMVPELARLPEDGEAAMPPA